MCIARVDRGEERWRRRGRARARGRRVWEGGGGLEGKGKEDREGRKGGGEEGGWEGGREGGQGDVGDQWRT